MEEKSEMPAFNNDKLNAVTRCVLLMAAVMVLITFASSCSNPKSGIAQATNKGDIQTVRALIKSNPNLVFDKDIYDTTPLHWAAKNGHRDVAELLVTNGANVNARNKYGDTPLHFAATAGSTEVVNVLLDQGAEVNIVDKVPISQTPLEVAASHGHKEIVELIRAHGGR